jgi:hypothetical protein
MPVALTFSGDSPESRRSCIHSRVQLGMTMKPSSAALLFMAWLGGSTQETLGGLAAPFRHKTAPRTIYLG